MGSSEKLCIKLELLSVWRHRSQGLHVSKRALELAFPVSFEFTLNTSEGTEGRVISDQELHQRDRTTQPRINAKTV